MIQRIQSLYLFLSIVALAVMFFLPLGTLESLENVLEFTVFKVNNISGTIVDSLPVWALGVLIILSCITNVVCILGFKHRMAQIRLAIFSSLLLIGFYLVLIVFIWVAKYKYSADYSVGFIVGLPLISIILNILAIRAIGADEALIKSLDRLR